MILSLKFLGQAGISTTTVTAVTYFDLRAPRPGVLGPYHFLLTVSKGKAIPLHAMEALGGRGGIAPTHSRPRH
jgi:hypothetical protein